jgi:hypothetical protein
VDANGNATRYSYTPRNATETEFCADGTTVSYGKAGQIHQPDQPPVQLRTYEPPNPRVSESRIYESTNTQLNRQPTTGQPRAQPHRR